MRRRSAEAIECLLALEFRLVGAWRSLRTADLRQRSRRCKDKEHEVGSLSVVKADGKFSRF